MTNDPGKRQDKLKGEAAYFAIVGMPILQTGAILRVKGSGKEIRIVC
jgi:hypothetical protein